MKLSSILGLLIAYHPIQQTHSQSTLASGWIITRSNVTPQSNLALDVRDIIVALENNHVRHAQDIYANGKNSLTSDDDIKRTLKELSYVDFDENPTYLFHIYGLSDRDASRAKGYRSYADNFVRDVLNEDHVNTGTLAVESIVALNMWMAVVNCLWKTARQCRKSEVGRLPEGESIDGSMDEAMAYWIGSEQKSPDKGGGGYSLFQMTQDVFVDFGGSPDEIAPTNEKIKKLYEEIRTTIAIQKCAPKSYTAERVFHITQKIVNTMQIPLIQKLIQAIENKDSDKTRMYGLAIVPQTSVCKASTHAFLVENMENMDFGKSSKLVFNAIQSSYDCLGITCHDISAPGLACHDVDRMRPLAGYNPAADVHDEAKIDLDVLQINVLSLLGNYHAVDEIYTFGKNSAIDADAYKYRSLRGMATSESRKVVTKFYQLFSRYHKENANYADLVISRAINGVQRFQKMPAVQRAQFITKTIQYQVMTMYALTSMHKALMMCDDRSTPVEEVILFWDKAIAYFIGSMDGLPVVGAVNAGGDTDGVLLYALANHRCDQFQTCTPLGRARLIARYQDSFFEGKGYVAARRCRELKDVVQTVKHAVYAPVFQSIIRYAISSDELRWNDESVFLAEGEVFAMSVLPLMAGYDVEASYVVEKNMLMREKVKPVIDGVQAVADAVYGALDSFGIDCEEVGAPMPDGRDNEIIVRCDKEGGKGGGIGGKSAGFGCWESFGSWVVGGTVMLVVYVVM